MLFFPWYPAMMLVVEANNVIDIRLKSIANGDVNAATETHLMFSEKIGAALDVGWMLMGGESSAGIINFYRKHVAANAQRLAPRTS